MQDDCLFCKIVAGDIPAQMVFEDEYAIAFMDINPVNPGHVLVVPKEHTNEITDMPNEAVGRLFRLVQHVAKGVREAVDAPGFNIGVNTGPEAGQIIFHTHVHVMPRFENDGHRHWEKKKVPEEEMARVADSIRATLQAAHDKSN